MTKFQQNVLEDQQNDTTEKRKINTQSRCQEDRETTRFDFPLPRLSSLGFARMLSPLSIRFVLRREGKSKALAPVRNCFISP